ncbi:Mpo1 family 2-hydroxy fatty acid dioxygenase [Qipengyuania seohaensis]|uniref:Mpo1 family 2-hydroxy fatty acid dioxygenase n=1 Tax=Qipengyuania seohaensis TaxID=266951 RepID=UPI000C2202FB|nr:Mpo1-like protein [Qipengyuania seohaensis]
MTGLVQSLASYREFHRDHRNVLTHALGIPMIVLSVEVLLARPVWEFSGIVLTPAIAANVLAALWYLRLDLKFGLLMTALLAVFAFVGHQIAQISDLAWLGGGVALFVIGWLFQFVGHHYEGRKPAFVDDIRSLLVGPLFMVAEGLFALGLCQDLRNKVEQGATQTPLRS